MNENREFSANLLLEESLKLQSALESAEDCKSFMERDDSLYNEDEKKTLNDKILSIKSLYFKTLNNDAKAFALKFAIKLKEKELKMKKLLNDTIFSDDKYFCSLIHSQLNRSAFLLQEMILIANNQ